MFILFFERGSFQIGLLFRRYTNANLLNKADEVVTRKELMYDHDQLYLPVLYQLSLFCFRNTRYIEKLFE